MRQDSVSKGKSARFLGGMGFSAMLILPATIMLGCGGDGDIDPTATPTAAVLEAGEAFSGGDTTVFDESPQAFENPAANLSSERRLEFFPGNNLFDDSWTTAPASASSRDGLGPTFNAKSCGGCHRDDGRGAPPTEAGEDFKGLLLRLSIPGEDAHGGPVPDPNYGGQIQHRAIEGVPAEASATVSYVEREGHYDDGTAYSLREPSYHIGDLSFGPLHPDLMISPRVAPVMIGLGLLEAISEDTLLALADPDDADGDGISGRVNLVYDVRASDYAVGRFGWKANQPTVEQQSAGAFLGDIGITTSLFPDQNCPPAQVECANALHGGDPELSDVQLESMDYYAHLLAVPARRDWDDPQVLFGKRQFLAAGCASCHVPRLETGELAAYPELSHQTIYPYTDLLLHDMGEGLADHRPDHAASGTEWRTPPLWGIGLVETVNGHTFFLHDGRARGFDEAILWHGGEAEDSQRAFVAMSADERAALIRFLESL